MLTAPSKLWYLSLRYCSTFTETGLKVAVVPLSQQSLGWVDVTSCQGYHTPQLGRPPAKGQKQPVMADSSSSSLQGLV